MFLGHAEPISGNDTGWSKLSGTAFAKTKLWHGPYICAIFTQGFHWISLGNVPANIFTCQTLWRFMNPKQLPYFRFSS